MYIFIALSVEDQLTTTTSIVFQGLIWSGTSLAEKANFIGSFQTLAGENVIKQFTGAVDRYKYTKIPSIFSTAVEIPFKVSNFINFISLVIESNTNKK